MRAEFGKRLLSDYSGMSIERLAEEPALSDLVETRPDSLPQCAEGC